MINRMMKMINAKQFLRTATINLVVINSKAPFTITDVTNYDNIQIINQQQYH